MSVKAKIATHFGVKETDLEYQRGQGWFYQGHFLHKSLYEIQHCPGWATKRISAYWLYDRTKPGIHAKKKKFEKGSRQSPGKKNDDCEMRKMRWCDHHNGLVRCFCGWAVDGGEDARDTFQDIVERMKHVRGPKTYNRVLDLYDLGDLGDGKWPGQRFIWVDVLF